MSKLEDFLGLGNVADIQEEIKVKIEGKELTLKIRAITADEQSDFQKKSTAIGKKSVAFDKGKYDSLLLPECIIEPNFKNAEFLEKAKCHTAWEFITKKFPAGVIADISTKVQELSGFEPFEEEVEEAKN